MAEKKAKRDRGRILSETGWQKLEEALQQWEVRTDQRRTFEKVAAEAGLDPGTVAKIFKRREGADLSKIERLLRAFQLNVEAIDHCPLPQGIAQSADPNFVGRAGAIADLNALVERGAKVIVIQARGGVGKTTLARKYLQQEFGSFLEFPIAKETKDIASIESLIEEKLKQLGEEPGREFLVSIDRLKRKLQGEAIGILIDNLEPALDSSGKFIEPHRRYVELLRVLSDPSVQSIALITSRERLYEPSVTVQHYLLNSLDIAAWEQFFQLRQLSSNVPSLAALHRAYGGNAKAMEIISSAIQTDYSGDVAAYWQANQDDLLIERALEDLVTQQFDRLQQLDQDAYNLLCRMGCYRYQDVPTVPIEGLVCLLWDVAENRHKRVIKVLQDLSLVEFSQEEYWLHPVIRSEAIGRLRGCKDWERTNFEAAEFWTNSVKNNETIKDAFSALEAYWHYIEIRNVDLASDVIIKERNNAVLKSSTLGGSLFRLGLFQHTTSMISQVIDTAQSNERLGILHDMLGASYLTTGDIHKAITYYQKLNKIAQTSKIKQLKILSLQGIGYCKIYLWEIEDAIQIFEECRRLHSETELDRTIGEESSYYFYYKSDRIAITYFFLAFLNSLPQFGETSELVFDLAEKSHKELLADIYLRNRHNRRSGHGFIFLGLAYKNVKQYEKASEMYNAALSLASESYYNLAKGIALSGLAELDRLSGDFNISISNHSKAVDLLEEIGAKSDLAEAKYQIGLTYQAMNELENSDANFQEAIRLFVEMQAPKQVDRVRRSMQNNI